MKHIVCFSGGKDSTALVLWAKENLPEFTTVFCDTGWEHQITYAYVEEINQTLLGGSLVTLKSEQYPEGMRQLVEIKGLVPSSGQRFCTEALKFIPMRDYLLTINDEVTVYQGIRRDESESRMKMQESCWDDGYDAQIERPLFHWSASDCFDLMKRSGVKPNPLYLLGASRVGCFPCVLINHREIKALSSFVPELRVRIVELERLSGRTFFKPGYIPDRFCSIRIPSRECECDHKQHPGDVCNERVDGMYSDVCGCTSNLPKLTFVPTAEDVFSYIDSVDEDQLPLLPARSCMSVYNLCE